MEQEISSSAVPFHKILPQEVPMYTYSWYQWLTFFYIYCFFGWIFESTYVSFKKRRFVNRGFLRLPMLPLYGTGAVMMLWVSLPVRDNLILVYFSGVVAATALEYVTGYVMEGLFKVKYWDYSSQRFQINGYICLTSSIAWGFLTIFLTEVIHKPIADFVLHMNLTAEAAILTIISMVFVIDVIQSTKEALALGHALEAMTAMKAELEEIQQQLVLLKAEVSHRMEDIKSDTAQRMEDFRTDAWLRIEELGSAALQRTEDFKAEARLRAEEIKTNHAFFQLEDRSAKLLSNLKETNSQRAAQIQEEAATHISRQADNLSQLAERIRLLSERRQRLQEKHLKLSSHMSFYRRELLKGNPTASSKKFSEAFKELKDKLNHV